MHGTFVLILNGHDFDLFYLFVVFYDYSVFLSESQYRSFKSKQHKMSFLKSPDMCWSTFSPLSTGNKVISRKLSTDSLAEVEAVLQRPPLIWDNLHANDYDSRRLFLGPFKDREPRLRNNLRGLLLNPNCEFEANYIPLHTLGSWYRAGKEESKGEEVTLKECGNRDRE